MKWFGSLFMTIVLACALPAMSHKPGDNSRKIDDWEYNATMPVNDGIAGKFSRGPMAISTQAMPAPMIKSMRKTMSDTLGFAVGGAKDANNFYDNLKNGYLPKLKSITYEGIFYDHYFDTGKPERCERLFCPTYATAVRKNFFTDADEYFLSVGLNSNIKASDFTRKTLNLVVVLDISGSMSAPFNRYYYDRRHIRQNREEKSEPVKSKMQIANESLVAMLGHLNPRDRLGIVLFDSRAYLAKPLRPVALTDMEAIKRHILELAPRGGTNWSEGYKNGLKLIKSLDKRYKDPAKYENRIIFITDAMPNRGELSEKGLFGMVDRAAKEGIYTTFIGVGVDFNTDLVERISKTRGANYYAVHSEKSFKKRLDDEFDFMVTPLVFDLEMTLDSPAFSIDTVYGSPEADKATGRVLYVNTLFPSATEENRTKGGVILVKLKKSGTEQKPIKLVVRYTDRAGKRYQVTKEATFKKGYYYENTGIRKAILLSDYVTLIQNWLIDTRAGCNDKVSSPVPILPLRERCMLYPPERPEFPMMQTWERRSCKLKISDGYRKLFAIFRRRFAEEMTALNDPSLQKEYDALLLLSGTKRAEDHQKRDDWQTER